MIHFTSDTHFGHSSAAHHRGFTGDVAAMNDALIHSWNHVVRPNDTVYHLGDLSFMRPEETAKIVRSLNGSIKLVPGNHDLHGNRKNLRRLLEELDMVAGYPQKLEVLERLYTLKTVHKDEKVRLELCHFPMVVWDRGHYGVPHLHGHSHGNLIYPDPDNRMLDVGVDAVGFHPVSLDWVLEYMRDRRYAKRDHHDPARVGAN